MDKAKERAATIAERNDAFRTWGYNFVLTRGLNGLADKIGLVEAVRLYDDFNESNDPYNEHDFGSLNWNGHKIFWKIDYYDRKLQYWTDPLSDDCYRTMTIMLAEEY